jgi:hypothetical protein
MTVTEREPTERTGPGEQTRGRYPDEEGYADRAGVRGFYSATTGRPARAQSMLARHSHPPEPSPHASEPNPGCSPRVPAPRYGRESR